MTATPHKTFPFSKSLLAAATAAAMFLSATGAQADIMSEGVSYVNESAYALDKQDWERAAKLARWAARVSGSDVESKAAANNNLCISLTAMGKYDDAMGACITAVSLSPKAWAHHNSLGNLYLVTGKVDLAIKSYETALTIYPGEDAVLTNLAIAKKMRDSKMPIS